jgi:hypothetical protein
VLAYQQKGSWQPYWLALLGHLEGVIPADWRVLVLADRGLYASWLYRQIGAQGWHSFLRINLGAKACLLGSECWEWLSHWLPAAGQQWAGRVKCFAETSKNRLECTLLLCQEPGYEEAWAIVTDLPAQDVHAAWYRLRAWIEGGFKDYKRGEWGWHHTKMTDPERAARLWLVLAVGTLWSVGVGCQAEVSLPVQSCEHLPERHIARYTAGSGRKQRQRGRELSCLTRGRLCLLAAVWQGESWPQAQLWPEAWPEQFPVARPLSEAQRRKREKAREHERKKRRKRQAAARATKRQRKRAA